MGLSRFGFSGSLGIGAGKHANSKDDPITAGWANLVELAIEALDTSAGNKTGPWRFEKISGLITERFTGDGQTLQFLLYEYSAYGKGYIDRWSLTSITVGEDENLRQGNYWGDLDTTPETKACYTSPVYLGGGIDLSSVYNVKLLVDDQGSATVIDCRGETPSNTTLAEIIAAINDVFPDLARETGSDGQTGTGYLTVESSTYGSDSVIEFTSPGSCDATYQIFGLSQTEYPHSFKGTDDGGYSNDMKIGRYIRFRAAPPLGTDITVTRHHLIRLASAFDSSVYLSE